MGFPIENGSFLLNTGAVIPAVGNQLSFSGTVFLAYSMAIR